jgi:MFS family permease
VLGLGQILAGGSTFYLLAVLGPAIVRDTGWAYGQVISGVSVGLFGAGLVSPWLGRTIGERGGRLVLALGSILIGSGLVALETAENLTWYLVAWLLIGGGMGAGLYDAAFATLGSIYARESRSAIASITLFGGFASTVCWPLSAVLTAYLGWRGACFGYAVLHFGVALPVYLLTLPRRSFLGPSAARDPAALGLKLARHEVWLFAVLAVVVTIAAAILSMMGNLVLLLLQARGLDMAAAVAIGTLIGPSAVGARVVESATSTTARTTMPSVTVGITPKHIPKVTSSVTPPFLSLGFPGDEDEPERHGGRHGDTSGSDNLDGDRGNLEVGRSLAVRNAARDAASLVGPESGYVARLLRPVDSPPDQPIVGETSTPVPSSSKRPYASGELDEPVTRRSGLWGEVGTARRW